MKTTLLLVQDDHTLSAAHQSCLEQAGYSVFRASCFGEALNAVQRHQPDIIISEWLMPQMNGLDLCRQIRTLPQQVVPHFILLVTDSENDNVEQAFEAGVNDFLCKPLDERQLLRHLHKARRSLRLERRLRAQNRADGWLAALDSPLGDGQQHRKPQNLPPPITILVADDNARMRQLCRTLLEKESHHVIEATNGHQAIEEVRKTPPALIIMDAAMPLMNGLECTRCLKSDRATQHIPIIMTSALDTEDDLIAGLQAGVDEYITKPFKPRELVLRVRAMTAAHNVRLRLLRSYRRHRHQALIQRHLLEFLHTATAAEQLDDILDQTIRISARLTGCQRISIMLPDYDDSTLAIARAIGIEDRVIRQTRLPFGSGTAGRVFTSGRAVIINSTASEPDQLSEHDSGYFVCTPLISQALTTQNTIVGVLNVTGRENQRPFGPRDLQCIDLICSISACAINAILTQETREKTHDSIVAALAILTEFRDDQTGKHLDRVGRYSLILAEDLAHEEAYKDEIDASFLKDIRRAVPLHDIGKVAIPDHILLKRAKLTDEEMSIMRSHAEIGGRIIGSMMERASEAAFLHMASEIAYYHHEWYDGSGYPRGLAGSTIPLSARIVAVADVYDAVTTRRVYKEAQSHDEAVAAIQEASGTHLDPTIVKAFLRCDTRFRCVAIELADADDAPPLSAPTDEEAETPLALAV